MSAEVDLVQPDVQLDYQVAHNGARTAGEYAGFDRFGRVVQQMWVDGGFTTHATSSTVPNIPPIFEQTYSYDKASNRLDAIDARTGAAWPNRDHVYSYDGLHRLSEAQRGVDGGTFAHAPNSQKWSLDMLGNWSEFLEDSTGDGDYLDTGEDEDRTHNDVNELTQRTVGANSFDLAFDDNGNMRENDLTSSTAFRYTHDLWNRLVKVEHVTNPGGSETVVTRGEYEYYGTHWRSVKKADSDLSGGVDELRQQYYTAGWQLIEERIDDSWTSGFTRDRTMQYLFGARYIDDILMHREDHDGDGDFTDTGSERWWHLTDVQFSTVAIVDDAAVVAERIQYDAYGRAYHHQSNDTDGDGDYDSTDYNAINTAIGTNIDDVGYEPDLDVDRDGAITDTDAGLAGTTYSSALSRGELSNATVKSTIGWDGYVFNPEDESYKVRHRDYDTALGRWRQRDPLEYVDGPNRYRYVRGRATKWLDSLGLLDTENPSSPDAQGDCCECIRALTEQVETGITAGPNEDLPAECQCITVSSGPFPAVSPHMPPPAPDERACRGQLRPFYPSGTVEFPTFGNQSEYKDPAETFHCVLDGLGAIPGIGEPIDITNGILYLLDGKVGLAAISFSSALLFGELVKAAKYADDVVELAGGASRGALPPGSAVTNPNRMLPAGNQSSTTYFCAPDGELIPKHAMDRLPTKLGDWEWRGTGHPGSRYGSWVNPKTGETLHPDLHHAEPIGPHYDYVDSCGQEFRQLPDGRMEPK